MRLQKNDIRVDRLRQLYQEKGCSSIVLTRIANLTWLLGGRVWIGTAGDTGLCKAVINDSGVYVLTNNIEGQRLQDEEFGPVPEICTTPWYDPAAAAALEQETTGAKPLVDTACENEMRLLRSVLLPEQESEVEEICRLCGEAVVRTVGEIKPGMTEFEISGHLSRNAISLGLQPIVLFTPVDERIATYRHPISGEKKLERIVMLSMGANRNGLHCSITRFVSFGAPDQRTLKSQEIACSVAARLYTKTVPGVSYDTLFQELQQGYAEAGAAHELQLHHQGGLAGFLVRESRVMPGMTDTVYAHQLYAWNPSAPGFKSEDMLLIGENGNRLLTNTPEFPHREYVCEGQVWRLAHILTV